MPRLALKRELRNRDISPTRPLDDELLRSIIELEQKYGMSRSALLVRIEDEQAISCEQKEWLSHDVKKNAFRLGFSSALYNRSQGESVKQTSGYYVDLIGELLANGAISRGKAREYLSGGFRNDIHVIELEGDDILDGSPFLRHRLLVFLLVDRPRMPVDADVSRSNRCSRNGLGRIAARSPTEIHQEAG